MSTISDRTDARTLPLVRRGAVRRRKHYSGLSRGVRSHYIGDYYEKRGSVVTKYYYTAGQRIVVRMGGVLHYLHTDHLGSATLTTDAGGNRVDELRYAIRNTR